MKKTFTCSVCGEKLTLKGTAQGIKNAAQLWAKGHTHPPKNTNADDLRNTLSLISDVCQSYDPLAAAITSRVLADAALRSPEEK